MSLGRTLLTALLMVAITSWSAIPQWGITWKSHPALKSQMNRM